jgi:hypothetical protein
VVELGILDGHNRVVGGGVDLDGKDGVGSDEVGDERAEPLFEEERRRSAVDFSHRGRTGKEEKTYLRGRPQSVAV